MKGLIGQRALVAVVSLGFILGSGVPASAQSIGWVRQFGSSNGDLAYSVATTSNLVIVAGTNVEALPGPADGLGCFVRAYTQSGAVSWTEQFACTTGYRHSISVYKNAIFSASVLGHEGLITKLNMSGGIIWQRLLSSSSGVEPASILATKKGIYVAGGVTGHFPGTVNSSTCASPCVGEDNFLVKFRPSGSQQWIRQFGSAFDDRTTSIAVKGKRLYLAGLEEPTCYGCAQGFTASYSTSGARKWYRGGQVDYTPQAIAVTSSGIVTAGSRDQVPTEYGAHAAYVQQADLQGNVAWTTLVGSPDGADTIGTDGFGLVTSSSGIYLCGKTAAPFAGQAQSGINDAFVARLSNDGVPDWTVQLGSGADTRATAIAASSSGLFFAGWTTGSLPSNSSSGDLDAFASSIPL